MDTESRRREARGGFDTNVGPCEKGSPPYVFMGRAQFHNECSWTSGEAASGHSSMYFF